MTIVAMVGTDRPLPARARADTSARFRVGLRPHMDFRCIYEHGFARVAACTERIRIADPPFNAEAVLRQARACDGEGVAVAVFPELCLTGYSIEDLLLQDAVLDGVEAALETVVGGVGRPPPRARGRRAAARTAAGSTTAPSPCTAAASWASRRSPTCRTTASSTSAARSPRATTCAARSRLAGADVPFGPDLLFEAEDVPGLVVHAEVCEDMWVPIPPSSEAALAGATVLREPLGQPDHGRPRRGPQAAVPCRSPRAAWPPTSTPRPARASRPPTCPGTGRRWSTRTASCWPRPSASRPATAAPSPTSTSTCCARSACGWGPSTTTAAPTPRAPARSGGSASRSRPRAGDLGLRRPLERFPFVPADPARLELDCYEAYNIQVAGLQQRLAAIGDAKVVIGVSGGLDSTQALIVAAQGHGPWPAARAATSSASRCRASPPGARPRATPTRLMAALGVTADELDITPTAELMLREIDHPYARGEEVYDVTFENVQAGLRTDYLFRIANQRGGIVLGTGDLSELALGWATYGVGDQMSHYNVNAGVPKTLIQHLIRWVVSSGQFERRGRRDADADPRHGDQPGARARRGAAVDRVQDRPVRAARLRALSRAALRLAAVEDRLPRLARVARRGGGVVAAELPRGQARRLRRGRDPPLAGGLLPALLRLRAVQALRAAERAEGLRTAGRCRRAATGARRRTGRADAWLRDLQRWSP